jgi:hypothetical protein
MEDLRSRSVAAGISKRVFAADNGVIYGITATGDLLWYRHQGRSDGTAVWQIMAAE